VVAPVPAPRSGWISAKATRDIGVLVVELGGGRRRAGDRIDHRVGFSRLLSIGQPVRRGEPLAFVHAADVDAAQLAAQRLAGCIAISDMPPAAAPLLIERITEENLT
jgi:thymidine phosphorylase